MIYGVGDPSDVGNVELAWVMVVILLVVSECCL